VSIARIFHVPVIGPIAQKNWHGVRRLFLRCATPMAGRRYLRTHPVAKLQLGASFKGFPGWFNTDLFPERWPVVRMDATRPFPLPDAAFQFIFSEHMIEHVPLDHARRMLRECFRVLRPGGWIRIATPDLARIVQLYAEPNLPAHQRYFARSVASFGLARDLPPQATTVNSLFYLHGHRFIFDEASLIILFREAGFTHLRRCRPGESEIPELHGIEVHHHVIGTEGNDIETLVLEGQKP
jgi:SAM-dependent methyltransferase